MESTHSQDGQELNTSGSDSEVTPKATPAEISPDATASQAPPSGELTAVQQALQAWLLSTTQHADDWVDEGHRAYDPYTFTLARTDAFEWDGTTHTLRVNIHTRGPNKFLVGGLWAEGLDNDGINLSKLHLESNLLGVVEEAMAKRRSERAGAVGAVGAETGAE